MINVGIIGGSDIRQGLIQNINVSPNAKLDFVLANAGKPLSVAHHDLILK
jgi:hypothetical protein